MYILNEEKINPLIQNHSQIPVPNRFLDDFFSFGLKYFLRMFSSLSLSFLSITIVNIASFILKFLNLPQGDILTKAEKHFETFAYLISRQVN